MIEIYLSILARKALAPCNLRRYRAHHRPHPRFQSEFAKTAQPFDWTFNRSDLHALLDRLDQRGRLTPAA